MSNSIDNSVELISLKESKPVSLSCKDEYLNCAGEVDHQDVTTYGSTFLATPSPLGPVFDTGKRAGVLPLFRERIREGSLRIRDKSRRRKGQKQDQRVTEVLRPQEVARGGKEFVTKTTRRDLVARKNRCHGNRFDSEFDISEAIARSKVHALRPKKLVTRGNDVQNLIAKDGKKKSDMSVCFDKDDACYSTGDTVKGHINITLTQEVRVKDLKLQFFGNGRVSWGEQRSYIKGSAPKILLRNTEVFLDHSVSLFRKDGCLSAKPDQRRGSSLMMMQGSISEPEDDVHLPAGVHNYPFEFELSRDLPGSFDGRWGQIRYCVRAFLVRPWKFDIEREREFTLKHHIDLNEEPELARPIGALGEFSPGIACIRSGAVTAEIRIGRRGYVPGESIQFYVEVENNSSRKLQDTSVALVQHVTYRAGKKTRKCSTTVASLNKGETPPNCTTAWNSDSVPVPSAPETSYKHYKGIQIKYTVSLLVKYSSWAEDFCLSVPVVLGTTGLRRQTINTYLSMLGYSLTPRASPANARRCSNGQPIAGDRPSTRFSLTAPPHLTGSVRHPSVCSLQSSVAKQRRISPVTSSSSSSRHGHDVTKSLSASRDNGLTSSFSVISLKQTASCKPNGVSTDSGNGGEERDRERDKEEDNNVEEEEDNNKATLAKKIESG